MPLCAVTQITDVKASQENHVAVVGGADMILTLLVLCLLGSFYAVFGVSVVRRATKPSCRNCLYWHDCCLNAQLGRPNPVSERCLTNRSEL
jgi:hypothetical protein